MGHWCALKPNKDQLFRMCSFIFDFTTKSKRKKKLLSNGPIPLVAISSLMMAGSRRSNLGLVNIFNVITSFESIKKETNFSLPLYSSHLPFHTLGFPPILYLLFPLHLLFSLERLRLGLYLTAALTREVVRSMIIGGCTEKSKRKKQRWPVLNVYTVLLQKNRKMHWLLVMTGCYSLRLGERKRDEHLFQEYVGRGRTTMVAHFATHTTLLRSCLSIFCIDWNTTGDFFIAAIFLPTALVLPADLPIQHFLSQM